MSATTTRPAETVIPALRALLGERVSTNDTVREQHSRGEDTTTPHLPDAVAFAETTEEVSRVLALCHQHGVPVVAFGAGQVGAPAGDADDGEAGADDVDVASLQHPGRGHPPDRRAVRGVEFEHRGVFAAPLRPRELAQHGATMRHHRGVAGIGHEAEMRLGREPVHHGASIAERGA
jgi:hypothetical protein